jgi:hypothetical protein
MNFKIFQISLHHEEKLQTCTNKRHKRVNCQKKAYSQKRKRKLKKKRRNQVRIQSRRKKRTKKLMIKRTKNLD